MDVYYYDIEKKLSLGKATACSSLTDLLQISDVITLHVPETELTRNMISFEQLELMKKGSILINLSRGTVVDYTAVAKALREGHLS